MTPPGSNRSYEGWGGSDLFTLPVDQVITAPSES